MPLPAWLVRKRAAKFVARAALVALLTLQGASPVYAYCVPNRPNNNVTYRDFASRSPGQTVGGVYSKLRIYNPYVPDSDDPTSGTYVEIDQGGTFFARVGWETWYGNVMGTRHNVVQWLTGGVVRNRIFNPDTVGTDHYFTVLWNGSIFGNTVTFQRDGANLSGPWNVGSDTPNYGFVGGVIHTKAAQMPGGVSTHVRMYDTNIWFSGAWQAFDGLMTFDPTYWGGTKLTTKNYEIWDKACSS